MRDRLEQPKQLSILALTIVVCPYVNYTFAFIFVFKQHEKVLRDLLKELPYFNCKRNLAGFHGRFNNLLQSNIRSKRYLDKLTSLYELDLFKL